MRLSLGTWNRLAVLNEHKKAIYLMQGIFVGNYGEMHGSKFLGQEDFMTLLNTFLDVTDDSLFLSFELRLLEKLC